jgi:Do/DeqQ family serine protease
MVNLKKLVSVCIISGALASFSVGVQADALPLIDATASQSRSVPSLAPIIDKVLPAVVTINVEGSKEVSGGNMPFFFGDPFGFDPFENHRGYERPFQALGSGVIVDSKEGYIVTNNHVIDEAKKITVTTHDGRQFEAKKIGADPQSDVALLKIEAKDLHAVSYSDSDELRVGDFAIAVGNPFGLGHTVTYGIISALGRSVDGGGNQFENYIQTDAPINQGNSGGSLIDLKGNLIGINTAIIAPNGGNVGIGFAIPSNMVKSITEQLIKYGEVRRGFLGIMGGELTPDLAEKFGAQQNKGAFVNQIMEGSAAEEAGIKAGDIIISLNGHKISSFNELRARIATIGAGSKVTLGIIRDGKEITRDVTLKQAESQRIESSNKEVNSVFDGVKLETATGKVKGAEIVSIDKKSNAARYGLQKGDIIVGVNREPVNSVEDLNKILSKSKGTQALNVVRGRMNMFIIIR